MRKIIVMERVAKKQQSGALGREGCLLSWALLCSLRCHCKDFMQLMPSHSQHPWVERKESKWGLFWMGSLQILIISYLSEVTKTIPWFALYSIRKFSPSWLDRRDTLFPIHHILLVYILAQLQYPLFVYWHKKWFCYWNNLCWTQKLNIWQIDINFILSRPNL